MGANALRASLLLPDGAQDAQPQTHGFSGPVFLHVGNLLAPEWLFYELRKINRLHQFSRTNPGEIRACSGMAPN